MIHLPKISSILLCLIPFALLTGPFLPDLFLSIIVLFFLFSLPFIDLKYYFNNKYFYVVLIFYILLLFSSFFSVDKIFSLSSSLFYFRFLIFIFAVWHLMEKEAKLVHYFFYSLGAAYLFALTDGYYQYFFDSTIVGITTNWPLRLTLPLDEKLYLGGYLVRIFPIFVGLYFFCVKKSLKSNMFLALIFILTDILIFLTAERSALALMSLFTVMILIFVPDLKRIRMATIIITLVIITIISVFDNDIKERSIDYTFQQMGINQDSEKFYLFSPVHDGFYRSGLKMFTEKPFFGHGPNMYRKICDNPNYFENISYCSTHPHNTYIQLLSETGAFGFIIVLSLLLSVLFILTKSIVLFYSKKIRLISNTQICLYLAIVLSLWPIVPTLNFFNNWISVIYFLPFGLIFFFNNSRS